MFKGSIVALITPIKKNGSICKKDLTKLINYHIKNKTSAIVSVGTTGESSMLSKKEHCNLIMMTLEISDGRIPIIAGTGSNDTSESINLTKKLENSGISGCLTVTPYYNRPTQEGLYQHFKSISESTHLPQILYNVPSRTGCDLLPETIARLSNFKNIIGIKEATGDLSRVNKISSLVNNKKFIILSGDDITFLDFIQLGGHGVISVTANIAAKKMSKICSLALNNNFIKARKINKKLMYLHKALFIESNPIPVKWAAFKLGLINNNILRLPLTKLSKKFELIVEKAICKAGII
ncbi:4-hydroxy-tetrahydrodipicolinate synthase [Candidatus Annandia pinicola]|uniref:4-hydroxy-tetrahydrodipicolinate synthase n=1 Tax=Candidatus Annandia pinicola TaxID=1345117 RepID=UPI001D00A16B|nr:4-hydroxy-tetrahydrodipicolinate synthase [Candidatus Annandia pinicola]UDG80333.1 4-hydroxy-tetrahydrodipicolinate synthase [Candidatus Annandia pinicola]